VQSSLQLHARQLGASASGGSFAAAAAEASASAMSPSSVASRATRDSAFTADGSTIAEEGRSAHSRVNMSFRGEHDASGYFARPSTFGEAAGGAVGQRRAQVMGGGGGGVAMAASDDASSSRHRILGEIEGLMRALKGGGGRQ
jgi:hypothetical protein